MKCPHCNHVTETALLKCSECGSAYDRHLLEEFQHVSYLLEWLGSQRSVLGDALADRLANAVRSQRSDLLAVLLPEAVRARPAAAPVFPDLTAEQLRQLGLLSGLKERIPGWILNNLLPVPAAGRLNDDLNKQMDAVLTGYAGEKPVIPELSKSEITAFVLTQVAGWGESGLLDAAVSAALYADITGDVQPERGTAPAVLPAQTHRLALLAGLRSQLVLWVEDGVLNQMTVGRLHDYVEGEMEAIDPVSLSPGFDFPKRTSTEILNFARSRLGIWVSESLCTETDAQLLNEYLENNLSGKLAAKMVGLRAPSAVVPAVGAAATPASTASVPVPAVVSSPKAPPRPREPLIQWDKVWGNVVEAAVSGLLLRWLRYLGAFLFVVSLGIVVVNFWAEIPQWGQVLIIFFIPAAFYGGGLLLRKRMGVVQTGGVLMGVGQILLAVDFAAIYQFGSLEVPLKTYWLITSVVCTLFYLLTLFFIVQDEFFGYIGLAALGSTLMAGIALGSRTFHWPLVGLAAFGVVSVEIGYRLSHAREKWREIGESARRFPQFMIPMVLLALLLIPGDPAEPAQAVTFWLASVAAGMIAWRFSGRVYVHAAVWLTALAAIFTLRAFHLPWVWYPVAGVGLSIIYTAFFRLLSDRMAPDSVDRPAYLLAFGSGAAATLLLGTAVGGLALFFDYWPGVIALGAAALALAGYSVLLKRPLFLLGADALAVLPVSLAVWRWLAPVAQRSDWLAAVWVGLALLYLLQVMLLRRLPEYGRWPFLLSHGITAAALGSIAGLTILRDYVTNLPILVVLLGALAVYSLSALLHHGRQYGAISVWTGWLFKDLGLSIFLYPLAALVPIFSAVAWGGSILVWEWLGVLLAGLSLAYTGLGQLMNRVHHAYRLPFSGAAYPIGLAAVLVSLGSANPLLFSLLLCTSALSVLAWVYRRPIESAAAGLLLLWPFGLILGKLNITAHAFMLGYVLLAGLGFIPLALLLRRKVAAQLHHIPMFAIGYGISLLAVAGALLGQYAAYEIHVPWIAVLVPLLASALYAYSTYAVHPWFGWATAAAFPLAFGQGLDLLRIRADWHAVAWAGLVIGYLGLGFVIKRSGPEWVQHFRLPANLGAWLMAGMSLFLTAAAVASALQYGTNITPGEYLVGPILAQALVVVFVILAAMAYRSGLPLYLEPWLAFLPVTLFFVAFGERFFGAPLTSAQFGIVWAGLGIVHMAIAFGLDQRRRVREEKRSQMFGLHLGGYLLPVLAVYWSLNQSTPLLWSFGILVLGWVASALLTHRGRHPAWEAILLWTGPRLAAVLRDVFFWLAAWSLPIWVTLLLWQLDVVLSFGYLGYAAASLLFLAAAFRLRRLEHTYGWALISSGQFYALLSLIMSVGTTGRFLTGSEFVRPNGGLETMVLGYVTVQRLVLLYYAGSSAYFSRWKWPARFFSYGAALLTWVPYSLSFTAFQFGGLDYRLAYTWIGLAAVLLLAGFALDGFERWRSASPRVGFAHGPYLAGWLGLGYAILWSWPDRLTNLYVLGSAILLALLSHAAVYYGRHETWRDFAGIFARLGENAHTIVRTGFLWVAVYAFPVWLASLLAHNEVPLAWRGLALALAVPVYVAVGLLLRRKDPGMTWPLYSAGYMLTAVGAMLSFEDQLLAVYVLALDAVVYAVSAYIFRQAFWLYLTTILTPIIGLLALEYRLDALPAAWIAGGFMGLAVIYLVLGGLFNRGRASGEGVSAYALAFFAPGYLLSAIGLAASSEQRALALVIFLVGVAYYAFSAWFFKESVFLYPAVWLAAVPYYLGMTYTRLDLDWYGIGWLPLIAVALAAGRVIFHKKTELRSLAHPALPFYILAYALSLSMVFIARGEMLALTVALAAAAALYLYSGWLFRRAWWLYPGLLALHAAILTAFSIEAIRLPAVYLPVGLLPVTLAMGFIASRLWKKFAQQGMEWRDRLGLDWALPFAAFAVVDVIVGQTVSLFSWDAGIITAVGHAALLGAVAWMWASVPVVWASVSFLVLGIGLRLGWAGLAWPRLGALAAGIGFGLYLTAWVASELAGSLTDRETGALPHRRLAMWGRPLESAGLVVNAIGLLVAFVFFAVGAEISVALAFTGALLLGISYRGRRYEIGYLGVALMEAAFVIIMLGQEVRQPQWYAIPVGVYFVGLGFFERRRGRVSFALLLESFGLIVLLLTSFGQSLSVETGFWYFLLLLLESVLVIVWSAQQRRKAPFLIGAAGMLANVIGQIVLIFLGGTTLIRWLIFGGLGLMILLAAIYAERWIIPRAQEMRERLEGWS